MKEGSRRDSEAQNRISAAIWAIRMNWQTSRALVVGMLGCTVVRGIVPAGFAVAIRGLINSVTEAVGQEQSGFEPQLFWLALAFAITISDVITVLVSQLFSDRLRSDLMLEVDTAVMRHASSMDLPYMENAENREVLARVRQDPGSRIHGLFTQSLTSSLFGLQVISLLVVLTWLEPFVLVFSVLLAAPFFVFQWRLAGTRYLTEYKRTKKRRWSRYFLAKVTSPATVGEIKQLGIGELLAKRFIRTMEEFRDQDRKLQLRQFRGGAVFAVITTIAFYLLFGRIVFRVFQGFLTVGDLAIFGGAVVRLRSALQGSIRYAALAYEQTLYVTDLRSFLESGPELADSEEMVVKPVKGELSVANVWFSYPGSAEIVLSDVSFHVKAGEKVAIVGENGSGKSTLAKLIVRLYDVDRGMITLDDRPVSDYPLAYLHSRVALLGQAFGKYEATFAENIAYGDWERLKDDRTAIEDIASVTGISHIADSLPDGLDTELGREFSEHDLSGGQWQLLAIARTLARGASVLILDEPTSNIDVRSEHALFNAIEKIAEGVTTIIISHRFSTIRMADRIVVMHEGRIVEQGSHNELMSAGGRYASLYTLHEYYRVRGEGKLDAEEKI